MCANEDNNNYYYTCMTENSVRTGGDAMSVWLNR